MKTKANFVALSTTKSNFSLSLFLISPISFAFPPAPPPPLLHFYSFHLFDCCRNSLFRIIGGFIESS